MQNRPFSAHVNSSQRKVNSAKKKRPVSEARSPAKSSRRAKKNKDLETKSVHTIIPDYSSSLEKTTRVLQVYDHKMHNLVEEKLTMKDLISRIKLEIKHTKTGNIDCNSVVKRYRSNSKKSHNGSRHMDDSGEMPELSCKELKLNQEKIYHATNKVIGYTSRALNENEQMFKEIKLLRGDIDKLQKQNKKVDKRKKKLVSRHAEETEIAKNLKQIIKKIKKAVKNTDTWNQNLRQANVKSSKRKKNLEQTLFRMQTDSQIFYERAQSQMLK
jgi:hypothetical protein